MSSIRQTAPDASIGSAALKSDTYALKEWSASWKRKSNLAPAEFSDFNSASLDPRRQFTLPWNASPNVADAKVCAYSSSSTVVIDHASERRSSSNPINRDDIPYAVPSSRTRPGRKNRMAEQSKRPFFASDELKPKCSPTSAAQRSKRSALRLSSNLSAVLAAVLAKERGGIGACFPSSSRSVASLGAFSRVMGRSARLIQRTSQEDLSCH